jgi:hypothetical protein
LFEEQPAAAEEQSMADEEQPVAEGADPSSDSFFLSIKAYKDELCMAPTTGASFSCDSVSINPSDIFISGTV